MDTTPCQMQHFPTMIGYCTLRCSHTSCSGGTQSLSCTSGTDSPCSLDENANGRYQVLPVIGTWICCAGVARGCSGCGGGSGGGGGGGRASAGTSSTILYLLFYYCYHLLCQLIIIVQRQHSETCWDSKCCCLPQVWNCTHYGIQQFRGPLSGLELQTSFL